MSLVSRENKSKALLRARIELCLLMAKDMVLLLSMIIQDGDGLNFFIHNDESFKVFCKFLKQVQNEKG